MLCYLLQCQRRVRAQHDEHADALAQSHIGHRHRSRFGNGAMAREALLDFARADVFAAANDDVFLAIGDRPARRR
jgi:hypothetical protein